MRPQMAVADVAGDGTQRVQQFHSLARLIVRADATVDGNLSHLNPLARMAVLARKCVAIYCIKYTIV